MYCKKVLNNSSSSYKENDEEFKDLPSNLRCVLKNCCSFSSKTNTKSQPKTKSNSKNEISCFNSCIYDDKQKSKFVKFYKIKDKNLYNIYKSSRLISILQNDKNAYMNNLTECSICFRKIISYGLLSNCNDVFCYECIKQWRDEAKLKNKREMYRRCPICNKDSPILIRTKDFLLGEEKRKKVMEVRKGMLK